MFAGRSTTKLALLILALGCTGAMAQTLHERAERQDRAEAEGEEVTRWRPPDNEAQIEAARLRARAARKAFEDARDNSTPDDWVYVGPDNPLGMRRFRKPEYEARLAELERQATLAERELAELERGR